MPGPPGGSICQASRPHRRQQADAGPRCQLPHTLSHLLATPPPKTEEGGTPVREPAREYCTFMLPRLTRASAAWSSSLNATQRRQLQRLQERTRDSLRGETIPPTRRSPPYSHTLPLSGTPSTPPPAAHHQSTTLHHPPTRNLLPPAATVPSPPLPHHNVGHHHAQTDTRKVQCRQY